MAKSEDWNHLIAYVNILSDHFWHSHYTDGHPLSFLFGKAQADLGDH